jgi:hypothetical protein
VRAVRIRGNTVLTDAELAAIAKPYEARELDYAQIQALRDALTLAYIRAGYVTSGAVIPSRNWADGVSTSRSWKGGSPRSTSTRTGACARATSRRASIPAGTSRST